MIRTFTPLYTSKHLFLTITALLISFQSHAQLAGWNSSRAVSIQNTSGAQKLNFQVLITLNTKALIDAGDMKNDGSDIRFAKKCDGTNLLNYFIESGINTPLTKIWLKLDTLPATGTKTLYLFYGNTGATAVSNFANTFPKSKIITEPTEIPVDTSSWTYDWIEIKTGGNVVLGTGHLGTFTMNARRIIVNGSMSSDGKGYLGGVGAAGMGPGGGQPSSNSIQAFNLGAGGGGGHGGKGGNGGYCCNNQSYDGDGGSAYGAIPTDTVDRGSGGGAAAATTVHNAGANGGGAFIFNVADMSVGGTAAITCNGFNAETTEASATAGGGGGAGGGILINADRIEISTSLDVRGGDGASATEGGGGGGGGHIKLHYRKLNANASNFDLSGGIGGLSSRVPATDGQDGSIGVLLLDSNYNPKEPIISFINSSPSAPGIIISADDTKICPNDPVSFTSVITNAGSSPVYQWKVNDNNVSGANAATFTSTALVPGDIITCELTAPGKCPNTAISNFIKIEDAAPKPTFVVNPDEICANNPVSITYTGDADGTASYAWTFDGGTIISGSGMGPYEVKWNTGGTKTISLSVTSECTSPIYNLPVTILNTPDASFSGLLSRYCLGASDATLIPATTGGIFSGPGMTDSTFSPTTAGIGTHTIKYVVSNGECSDSVLQMVQVSNVPPDAHFSYPTTSLCQGDENVAPIFSTEEGKSGYFNSTPSGLNITNQGIIEPLSSQPGSYTITNTIPASGGCAASSSSFSMVIKAKPDATFNGLNPSYCTTEPYDTLMPVTPGGAFSSIPNTLSINSINGELTPFTSTPGNYQVIYTADIDGCVSADTLTTTIKESPDYPETQPSVSYCQNDVAVPLTATGQNLLWYTVAFGGIGSGTAPTPSTAEAGTTEYYVTQTNSIGCESFRRITSVVVSVCNGVSENELEQLISVYPNPATEKILISADNTILLDKIILSNTLGQELIQTDQNEINVSNIQAGIYLLHVYTEKGIVSKRIQIIK